MEEILRSGFSALSLTLPEDAPGRFKKYFEYLEEQGALMNLTAITGERDVATLHFLDCAAVLNAAAMNNASVIDVGAGAGFPRLVLKIAEPSISLTMLDSLKKRVDFLTETCELLGYEDVRCVHLRAEEAPAPMRESFDFAVSRAVARLSVLCELCLPFVRVGGALLAMKGPDPSEELSQAERAMTELGASPERVYCYTIPGTDVAHSVAVIRKVLPTPARYPRRFSRIQKSPL